MKRVNGILAGVLSLAALMVSCVAEQETPEVDITTVRCTISQIDVEEDFATGILDTLTASKATFSGANFLWSEGDKIGIVPNTGAQIYFEVTDGAGTSTALFDGGDWAMKSTGTFYAYYPLYPDIFLSKDHVSVSYIGQTQSSNNNNLHTGNYWTLYTEGTTAVGNTLSFSFNHLTSFFKTYVTVPAGTYTKIAFSAPSEVFIKDGYFDLSAQTPAIVGTTYTNELCLDLQNITFADETELTGYLVVAPVDITGIPITVTIFKDGGPAYEYTLTKASPMVPAKTYAFRATAISQLVSSVAQANALFASGATAVTITEPLTEDATIVLPNTSEAVTITLPTTASASTLTVTYPQNVASYPATVSVTGPEGSNLDIQTPNSTVTVNGASYNQITSRTSANTCIISAGVSANLLKVIQGGVQVYGTVTQIDLSEQEDDAIISVSGTVSSLLGEDAEEYIPASSVTLSQSSINLNVGANETLIASVAPAGAYPKVVWSSSDDTVATVSANGVVTAISSGSATITAETISEGFTATCTITVDREYVDLGLPSGIKWATCNVGADSPENPGNFYAWGETETKSQYNWASYIYCNGSETTITRYCIVPANGTVDNKISLDPEDDVAHVCWGDNWRMPTKDEFGELVDNCTWTWTSLNGVNGYRITGSNSNSIFLPISGYKDGSNLKAANTTGYFWSSSLDESSIHGRRLTFNSNSSSINYNRAGRYYGFPVRPVYGQDPNAGVTGITLDRSSATMSINESLSLNATVSSNAGAVNKDVQWSSSNTAVATVDYTGTVMAVSAGNATITARTVFGGFTATCVVTVQEVMNTEYEWVDLGLSVKWATVNLGASSPEDYGDYYAWGETSSKSEYSWANYKYCNGSNNTMTKYCTEPAYGFNGFIDGDILLDPEDDAATFNLGSNWRMPTADEVNELLNNTTWTWTTLNDVYGCKLQSKKDGYTDKWIFLPANRPKTEGGSTYYIIDYWTKSLNRINNRSYGACRITSMANLYEGQRGWSWDNYDSRFVGCPIRPVYSTDPSAGITGISMEKTSVSSTIGLSEPLRCTVSLQTGAVNNDVEWRSSNPSIVSVSPSGEITAVATGIATVTASTVFGGFSATCNVTVGDPSAIPLYVDLGLSVKWASFNVGASSPDGFGDYFAWGETSPYYQSGYSREDSQEHWKSNYSSGYTWSAYKYSNTSYSTITKYCYNGSYGYNGFTDSKTVLDSEDDVATVNWGSGWRMPTATELEELISNCVVTKASLNGIDGYKVDGCGGYSSNWIFIPVAGYRREKSIYIYYGYYWLSSLATDYPYYASYLELRSTAFYVSRAYRYFGCTVRPVYDGVATASSILLNKSEIELYRGHNEQLIAVTSPSTLEITWSSSNSEIASVDASGVVTAVAPGTATITATITDTGSTARCDVTVSLAPYVDLGLSVKWARCNVGASSPEITGYTFAWGETTPCSSRSWSDYKYGDGSKNALTKYNTSSNHGTVDNKTVLENSDDAAYVNLGRYWRMPTLAEVQELINNCTWTWTTLDGSEGYWVTGPYDDGIFLPKPKNSSSYWFWSSSLSTEPLYSDIYARALAISYIYNSSEYSYRTGTSSRNGAHYVRPVYVGQ